MTGSVFGMAQTAVKPPAAAAPEPVAEAPKRAPRARKKPEGEPALPGAKGVEAPVYANPAPEPVQK